MARRALFRISTMFLVLLCAACGGSGGGGDDDLSTDSCDLPGFGRKILFGTACDASRSAVVHITIAPPGESAEECSGTLISSLHVLTAGHCVPDLPAGVSVAASDGASIPASAIVVHPGFKIDVQNNVVLNDAAIIVLSRPAVGPIAPILTSSLVQAGDQVSVYGFGLDEHGVAGILKSGEMRLTAVISNLLQAQFTGAGVNTCLGDSGGPMVAERTSAEGNTIAGIVGIVSTGTDADCQIGDISTYTNVQFEGVLSFIRTVVPSVRTV